MGTLKFAICLQFVSAHFYCKLCFKVSKYWLLIKHLLSARLVDSVDHSNTVGQ